MKEAIVYCGNAGIGKTTYAVNLLEKELYNQYQFFILHIRTRTWIERQYISFINVLNEKAKILQCSPEELYIICDTLPPMNNLNHTLNTLCIIDRYCFEF